MWIFIAISAYFINAGVYVADKFLLSKKIHSSISYAFFVGIWSVFNFLILPLDFWIPTFQEFSLDILAGLLFLITLIVWYKALHQSEATRVIPVVGALTPIFSFALSYIFFGEVFSERQFLAFIILVIGGIMISVKQTKIYILKEVSEKFRSIFGDVLGHVHAQYRPTRRLIVNSMASALLFASYYVLMKYIYSSQPFIGGFVWSRLGTFVGVLLMLFVADWRRKIVEQQKGQKSPKNMGFFFGVRLLAALAFILLNWSISLGNVAMINALQGIQFSFLIILVLVMSKKYPNILDEEMGRGVMFQKGVGVVLISLGLYVLVT
ncbi:MAG: EamA family transporter [Patescibacteria group bacterium]|jgi:drug/metabolite transporter (DMT)-like permease|nr:EamA family transporter [Patescibacteria group bacterium]